MVSPGLKSTSLYGPVPTGFVLFGASRDLPPLYASKRCLGMIWPREAPQKASDQNGVGFLKVIFAVWLSTLSMRAMSVYAPDVTAAVAGSAAYSQLKTTSSAVNGLPSCQFTPRLSFHVTEVPSRATPPFCTLGISAASTGMRLPSGS